MTDADEGTVLILEDDEGVARLERLRLERAGYSTVLAATPAEAIRAIQAGGIDLMVLDYQLDGASNGIDFNDQVRSSGFDVPSILVTGFGDEAMLTRALRAGIRDFIPKTAQYLDFLAPTVARVMAQTKTERALAARQQMLIQERNRSVKLQRLAAISSRLNAMLDLESVLHLLTEEARALVGAREAIATLVFAEDWTHALHAVALQDPSAPAPFPIPSGVGPAADVRLSSRSVRVNSSDAASPNASLPADAKSWLAAPLIDRQGRNMGLVQLFDKPEEPFSEDDEAILVQLAQMASVAVENARFYQELRENDQRKDEFLAMLAHELRNPLAAIDSAVEVSRREALAEHFEWAKDVIQRQTKHLSRLIDDLLDISRINLGKIQLRKERVELGPIVDRAVESVRPIVDGRGHVLVVSLEPGPLHIEADPARLEQIFVNLLSNAAKYTPEKGRIDLSAHLDHDEIVVEIKDNGVGIDARMLSKIFDAFIQVEQSIDRAQGGLGIGLTLVRRLLEMHGGSITATSSGPGQGSSFVVRMPACGPPAVNTSGGEPNAVPTTPVTNSKARILIVDDSVDTAKAMAKLLAISGYEVHTSHDGSEAIAAAHTHRPDVMLLDIGLPGKDGYQIAREVRHDQTLTDIILIAISGYAQDHDRRRSREAGFDYHLIKPVDYDLLYSLLNTVTRAAS